MALFIQLVQDCMKDNHLAASSPELMVRLAGYEAKLLSETKEVLEPEAPAKSGQDPSSEISYSVDDMPLVKILGPIFQKTNPALQKDVDYLHVLASEQVRENNML